MSKIIVFFDDPAASVGASLQILASLPFEPSEGLLCPVHTTYAVEAQSPKEDALRLDLNASAMILKGELAIRGCTTEVLSICPVEFSRYTWQRYAVESTYGIVLNRTSKSNSNLNSFVLRHVVRRKVLSAVLFLQATEKA